MAKIVQEMLVIKFSKLVKDSEKQGSLVNDETYQALEQVVQELVGDGVVVEVIKE